MGLLCKEYNEFIVYWLPKLEKNAYNLITFQSLDAPIEIKEMEIKPFNREGFTVIEWGGCELKK